MLTREQARQAARRAVMADQPNAQPPSKALLDLRESLATLTNVMTQLASAHQLQGDQLNNALTLLVQRNGLPQPKETYPVLFTGRESENGAVVAPSMSTLRWRTTGSPTATRCVPSASTSGRLPGTGTDIRPRLEELTWDELKQKLLALYGLTTDQALQRAFNRSQKEHESVGSFADDIQRLLAQASSSGGAIADSVFFIIIIITWSANPKPEAIGHTRRASAATSAGPTVVCSLS